MTEKEKTAPVVSVGADTEQSILKQTNSSITDFAEDDKSLNDYLEEMQKEFLQQLDPSHLKTISMRELYNTVYQSKPPLIDALLYPGTVCVESALFYYGYSDFAPREWSIAVPRTYRNQISNIQEVPIKAYYVQKNIIELGKTIGDFNGVTLPVYDRERTICDCFKYRTKLDSETFNKALNAYVSDDKKNLLNLSKYAKEMHVYTKMMSVMEVLLNG
jgi:predicted transcriptional regulator of viral defense system